MKPQWKRYLESLDTIEDLMSLYLEMRRYFQKIGWSEYDLEKPPYFSKEMHSFIDRFQHKRRIMFEDLLERGFDLDIKEFNDYLKTFMIKINELTPLSDVGYKRNNSGDEDY
jgi:hypothetical protein